MELSGLTCNQCHQQELWKTLSEEEVEMSKGPIRVIEAECRKGHVEHFIEKITE